MEIVNSLLDFEYDNRYVCFLDVLGCKDYIYKSVNDERALDKIKLVAELFYDAQERYSGPHWKSCFVFPITANGITYDKILSEEKITVDMSLFSDSIIISYAPKEEHRFVGWYRQMYQILNDICRLQFEFARNGIFLRGGMSYGKLFHKGNICFGPALINAVELEKIAVNPCIAVDNKIIDKIFGDMRSDEIDDYSPGYKIPHELSVFARDLYGTYFDRIDSYGKNAYEGTFMIDWLVSRFYIDSRNISVIKAVIEGELQKDYIPKIREKYEWLKKYYNHTIFFEEGHENMRIK